MRLKGKVALVTGAASGIGTATAKLFASEGASVGLADISQACLDDISTDPCFQESSAVAIKCDVTSMSSCEACVQAMISKFGRLDILVNSAGVTVRNAAPGEKWERVWDKVIDVNLKGSVLMSRLAAEEMKKAGAGSIINISSINGLVGYAQRLGLSDGFSPYAHSKGALLQVTRDASVNLAAYGIRTNCVCPGFIETAMTAGLRQDAEMLDRLRSLHPLGRLGSATEVANAILFLASDEASFITGSVLTVDGGYTAQ